MAVLHLWSGVVFAESVTVTSLQELLPYLQRDKVDLKMKPGTYTVTGKATKAGKFGVPSFQEDAKAVFLITGSNSSYDFTGVTIKIETSVCQSLGKNKVSHPPDSRQSQFSQKPDAHRCRVRRRRAKLPRYERGHGWSE